MVRPDGKIVWIEERGQVLRINTAEARHERGVLGFDGAPDAEQQLRDSEARNRAVLETSLDCIISIDVSSRIIEFNAAAERTFGYKRADVMGHKMAELIIPPRCAILITAGWRGI